MIKEEQLNNKSLWHKTYDFPEAGKKCLVEYEDPDLILSYRIDMFANPTAYEWKNMCHYDHIIRWIYIEDLIKL